MKANLRANLLRVADLREGMVVDYYDSFGWYEYATLAPRRGSDTEFAADGNLFGKRYFLIRFLVFQEENEVSLPGYFWQVVRLPTEPSQQSNQQKKFAVTKAKFVNRNVFEMVVNHEPNSPTNIG